jgi:hypothetical protein
MAEQPREVWIDPGDVIPEGAEIIKHAAGDGETPWIIDDERMIAVWPVKVRLPEEPS